MLRGYQPRRVVREGEREERPGEVDSQADQRILMKVDPRGDPLRRLIPRWL